MTLSFHSVWFHFWEILCTQQQHKLCGKLLVSTTTRTLPYCPSSATTRGLWHLAKVPHRAPLTPHIMRNPGNVMNWSNTPLLTPVDCGEVMQTKRWAANPLTFSVHLEDCPGSIREKKLHNSSHEINCGRLSSRFSFYSVEFQKNKKHQRSQNVKRISL